MARFCLNIKTCYLYVIWESRIKFGQKFFASPKICTPVQYYSQVKASATCTSKANSNKCQYPEQHRKPIKSKPNILSRADCVEERYKPCGQWATELLKDEIHGFVPCEHETPGQVILRKTVNLADTIRALQTLPPAPGKPPWSACDGLELTSALQWNFCIEIFGDLEVVKVVVADVRESAVLLLIEYFVVSLFERRRLLH